MWWHVIVFCAIWLGFSYAVQVPIQRVGTIPKNGPLCNVDHVSVSEGAGGQADVLKHVTYYTEVSDDQGRLKYPENIEFAQVQTHFFSCVDPRAKYAVLGTLGGDIGEFIIALAAFESVAKKKTTLVEVNRLLQDYVRIMASRGKQYFYMHTDKTALDLLRSDLSVLNPLLPQTSDERNLILKAIASKPEYMGCLHLRGMLADPAGYQVRLEVTQYVIKVYYNVLFDNDNPLRSRLLHVVSEGDVVPGRCANILSPDQCVGAGPLVVPNNGETSLCVSHDKHVNFYREDLARFFAFQSGETDAATIYAAMLEIAKAQAAFKSVYGTEDYDVSFTASLAQQPF